MLGPEKETGSTLPLSDAEQVDRLCDQFMAAHRNNEQPRIEDYLVRAPEGAENQLLRDLIAEELDRFVSEARNAAGLDHERIVTIYAGRARVRLADREALYRNKPGTQQLPAWWEYLNILALTKRRDWTEAQLSMMSAACRYYATRAAALAVLVAVLAWSGTISEP